MTDASVATLLPALNIAAFRRGADGSFSLVAPPPRWFTRAADVTFPFLGHILDEATEFWRSGASGSREFGPCEEIDESGRRFHYRIRVLTIGRRGSQFLVFEFDPGSDRLRDALQKAREQALVMEQNRAKYDRAAAEIRELRGRFCILRDTSQRRSRLKLRQILMKALRGVCEVLLGHVDRFAAH